MCSPVKVAEFSLDEEYKKHTRITPQDIRKLRDWLMSQPHLPGDLITELELILTYHRCDCSPEVSKQVLDLHYTLKTLFTNFFKNRAVDDVVLRTCQVVLLLALEERTDEGYAIFYIRLLDYDVKKIVLSDILRVLFMLVDLWQLQEGTWPGLVMCIDLDCVTLGHLTRLDLQSIQQVFYYLQEAMLVKLKSVHFLNAPSFMDKLMLTIKPFMKKALLDIIVIHQIGAKTLDQYVPKKTLPKDLGGEYRSFQQCKEDIITRLKLNADFFEQDNRKRVLESRRPGKPKTISDIFGGVEGSFKKLDID